jgi:predicted nucleic acid-binding protein
MPTERRFVFDTNVSVSALLLKRSIVRQAFDKATEQGKLLEEIGARSGSEAGA